MNIDALCGKTTEVQPKTGRPFVVTCDRRRGHDGDKNPVAVQRHFNVKHAIAWWTTPLLTRRQTAIMTLVANGACNKQVATAMNLSVHTVKMQMSLILARLHAVERTRATAICIKLGLIPLSDVVLPVQLTRWAGVDIIAGRRENEASRTQGPDSGPAGSNGHPGYNRGDRG